MPLLDDPDIEISTVIVTQGSPGHKRMSEAVDDSTVNYPWAVEVPFHVPIAETPSGELSSDLMPSTQNRFPRRRAVDYPQTAESEPLVDHMNLPLNHREPKNIQPPKTAGKSEAEMRVLQRLGFQPNSSHGLVHIMCAMDRGSRALVILGGRGRGGRDLALKLVEGGGGEGRVLGPVSLEVSVIFENVIEQMKGQLIGLVRLSPRDTIPFFLKWLKGTMP